MKRQPQTVPPATWTKVHGLPLEVKHLGAKPIQILVTDSNELILCEGHWSVRVVTGGEEASTIKL